MSVLNKAHILIDIVTIPGVVIHEYSHKTMCDFFDVPVSEVKYFQFDNPPGYVIHAEPRSYVVKFLISMAPFILNSILAAAAFYWTLYITPHLSLKLVLTWIGFASAAQSFPSKEDAHSLIPNGILGWLHPLVLLGLPVVGITIVANKLRIVFLHVIYAVVLFIAVVYVPKHNIAKLVSSLPLS